MKIRNILFLFCFAFLSNTSMAQHPFCLSGPRFSTAGFFKIPDNNSRQVFSFNNGWLYHKGNVQGAEKIPFADDNWIQVELPHGVDIRPENVSGGANYQGVVWYRKHFLIPNTIRNKKITLTFEAIMGKCKIYLNGRLIKKHKGGYLPIILDLSNSGFLHLKTENVIAVMADNSNDSSYPPGKPEYALDFSYLGGIYRDAWLVATEAIHITNANLADKVAGGGVRIDYKQVSSKSAQANIVVDIQNESSRNTTLKLSLVLKDKNGSIVANSTREFHSERNQDISIQQHFTINNPLLWSPDHPYLYNLYVYLRDKKGEIVDGYYLRTGIKSVELKGDKGLYLNGKPFKGKLMGANHHQDYAYIGNGVPDNLLWRDAKILRDAGIRILRLSHYPQSPAFMDACDELGIFTIVCSPGWQFWNNKNPEFEKLFERNIHQMIRRDRNHVCVFAWEPLPNETHYPAKFGQTAYEITHEEDPSEYCLAANNYGFPYWQQYELIYGHVYDHFKINDHQCIFVREWGDDVDNWYDQNSPSRASIAWGEVPQLVQARHYSNPPYYYGCWETFYEAPKKLIGGCLWHSFDTPRGYHPDPFYGGIVDAFRRPKYAYYLFQSQQDSSTPYVREEERTPYYLFIANIMSPFSPEDVTVYTNCDSVKLLEYGLDSTTLLPDPNMKMPHAPLIFKNVFHFMRTVDIGVPHARGGRKKTRSNGILTAIGYAHGKEVIKVTRTPAGRPTRIVLKTDMEGLTPVANGSCIVPVFAYIEDDHGNIKRLDNKLVHFHVKGEGILIGGNKPGINPHPVEWGAAAALVRTTLQAGKIEIAASLEYPGNQDPAADTLIVQSVPTTIPTVYEPKYVTRIKEDNLSDTPLPFRSKRSEEQKKKILKKVGKQQTEFMK